MVLILVMAFVFFLLPILVGLALYKILKHFGYPKTAQWFIQVYVALATLFAVTTIFEDELFSENDAEKLLTTQEIELHDPFSILKNESMWAIGESFHTFTLRISENDQSRLIASISSDSNFKKLEEQSENFPFTNGTDQNQGKMVVQNYEMADSYIRTTFRPREKGYAPVIRKIIIDKMEPILIFEDIDD